MHMLFIRVLLSGECLMINQNNKNGAFTHSADTRLSLGREELLPSRGKHDEKHTLCMKKCHC